MDERLQTVRCERRWIEEPLFFISAWTRDRRPVLNSASAVNLLLEEWKVAQKRHGWNVGRYLVMPDRVGFFCAAEISARPLSQWLQIWKEWTAKRLERELGLQAPLWDIGFSKQLLGSWEGYSQKLGSLLAEPEQARLVVNAEDWEWQGEVEPLT